MFCSITVDSWKTTLSLFDKITDKNSYWAFRGQADERWDLSTKFEREARKYHCDDPDWYRNREHYILHDFQRFAHHYIQNPPKLDKYSEWLSLLQHYGGPTRLLDFTYSSYVALFFAVEVSTVDSVIWGVNINNLLDRLSKIPSYDIKRWQPFEKIIERNNDLAEAVIKDRKNDEAVFLVEPFLQHERISIQQGLFLFPGNIDKTFASNICSIFELEDLSSKNALNIELAEIGKFDFSNVSVCKIVIPFSFHSKAVLKLRDMNLTAATLFPGLDGFARSLYYRFPELDNFINS